jgi:DNA-binding response OmpR family regulator
MNGSGRPGNSPRHTVEPDPAPKPTLLVIEDDKGTAVILRHILAREGFEVVHVADGRKAIDRIGQGPPPILVLTDMMLPHVDGQEIIRRIRGDPAWGEVPIVVLTSKTREEDTVQALDAGATDYVQKPFRPEELLARVRRCLRPRR